MITKITAKEAKKIIDTNDKAVIVDVRNENEYSEGHIQNAILLPLPVIEQKAKEVLKDQDQLLLVHCRSGVRSKQACMILDQLGYTNINDFGGIIDWPYEIVK